MCAVPNMAAPPLIACFPDMLLRYCLEWFWNGSSRPFCYWYHICFHIAHTLNLCSSFLITFLSSGIATSVDMHVACLLSRIVMSLLLLLLLLLLYHHHRYYLSPLMNSVHRWAEGHPRPRRSLRDCVVIAANCRREDSAVQSTRHYAVHYSSRHNHHGNVVCLYRVFQEE